MCGAAEWEWDEKEGGRTHPYAAVDRVCRGCEMVESVSKESEQRPGVRVELMHANDPRLREQQERYAAIRRRSRE